VFGAAKKLVFIDVRNMREVTYASIGGGAQLIIANTNAKHSLAEGAYNRLRTECFAAANFFAVNLPHRTISHLRDVSLDDYNQFADKMPENLRRRAKHVITENARVLKGVEALRRGDLQAMGDCMTQSHLSSRNEFGNSSKELDMMFDCAESAPGLYGRRLSGGGFGGCTVNLVSAIQAKQFAQVLAERYKSKSGIMPTVYCCRATDGAAQTVLQ
jgi:galactokinase